MGIKTVLLCDDDLLFAEDMKIRISELFGDRFDMYTATDETFSIHEQYDIYFLDIDMPTVSGFTLATEIHERYPDALLIFLTSHEEFSMDGYEYRAFRFISKKRLDEMLPRVVRDVKEYYRRLEQYTTVKDNGITIPLLIHEIDMIISEGNYMNIYHGSECYRKRIKVKKFLMQYAEELFIHVERGILVNMRNVKRFDMENMEVYMKSGRHTKVGKKYKEEFLIHYMQRGTANFR